MPNDPKVLSDTEIDALLQGSNRTTDRVILEAINGLTRSFLDFKNIEFPGHAKREEEQNRDYHEFVQASGGVDLARARALWIDTQIEAQRDRTAMMRRVRDSVLIWVVILFIGYMALSVYQNLKDELKGPTNETRPVQR